MLTADRLKPGWRWQAHGEQLHASVYHTAQANQAFKDSLQASVMSQAIVFDPDAPDNSPTSAYAAVRSDFDACLFLMSHVASQQSTQTLLLSEYLFLRFVR
jgi:hypothetical protein